MGKGGAGGCNTTVKDAGHVKGTNPQFLIEKITRLKIWGARYWKEHCFGLGEEGIVDKAIKLKYLGGVYGGDRRPTDFMCLLLKMLQIQPDKVSLSPLNFPSFLCFATISFGRDTDWRTCFAVLCVIARCGNLVGWK